MKSFKEFYELVEQENIAEIENLINNGFDLNKRDNEGATVLFFAILQGNINLVRLLLERGADANVIADEPAASIFTEKTLDLAQQLRFLTNWNKYHPIVKLLENYGATDYQARPDFNSEELEAAKERAIQWQESKIRGN